MNTEDALNQLRRADPVMDLADTDPVDESGAMLSRILREPVDQATGPRQTNPPRRRRLVLAGAVTATAVAGVAIAGVVSTPWSHGQKSGAAWAIDGQADGSLRISVKFDGLRNPAALNRELRRRHAHAVVMQYSAPGACTATLQEDPAHPPTFHLLPGQDPAREMRRQAPWLIVNDEKGSDARIRLFTIHPDRVPSGDTVLVMYSLSPHMPGVSGDPMYSSMLVRRVPSCLPDPDAANAQHFNIKLRLPH